MTLGVGVCVPKRREIVNGAATFADQAPVRAAIHGRVLVIDGLLCTNLLHDTLVLV